MDIRQQEFCNILLIGDSCVDKFHYGTCDRISPEAPVSVFKHQKTDLRDGMCLNVQKNLLAFSFAEISIITNSEVLTKERFIDIDSGQHLLRTDFGETNKVKPLMVTTKVEEDISLYDYVVISDYEKGFINYDTAEKITNACLSRNVPLFVDSKKRDLSCFDGAIIKINEKEYDVLDKTTVNEERLVVTYGKNGAKWNGNSYPTNVVEISDVSGAGDTFLSALVYGHYAYNNMEEAIRLANRCSGFVVQKSGTYPLTWQDVQDLCS